MEQALESPLVPPGEPAPRPTTFYLPFRGTATLLRPGVLLVRATAPPSALRTTIDDHGAHARVDVDPGPDCHLESRISLAPDGTFDETGTLSFGYGNVLRYRSVGRGVLTPAPDGELEHGAVSCEIDLGAGAYAGVRGRIVSSFLLSTTGDLAHHLLGVVFVPISDEATRDA